MKCEKCDKICEWDDLRSGTFVQKYYFLCSDCDDGAISIFDLKDGVYGVCVTKEEFDTEALDKTFEMGRRVEESVQKCDKERESVLSHILGASIVGLLLTALFFL